MSANHVQLGQVKDAQDARVLLADDDPILREFAIVHLTSDKTYIEVAEDGLDALEKLRAGDFDIALVDLDMPRMDGFELIAAIRSDPKLENLPVIVITGREDMVAIDKAYGAGATSFAVKPLNWLLISHQITYVLRNSRSEATIREARKAAEQADALKTNILRLMRHEFNTPFNVISGYGKLIEAHSGDAAIEGHARQILNAVGQFQRLHDDLLETARIFSGDIKPVSQAFYVDDLIKAATKEAYEKCGAQRQVKIIDQTHNGEIIGDLHLLSHSLRNLIENALTHGAGIVNVIAQKTGHGDISIVVADSGPGIDSQHFQLVTQPFAQGDGALMRNSNGLGLGLATASGSLKAVGGKLNLIDLGIPGFAIQMQFPSEAA